MRHFQESDRPAVFNATQAQLSIIDRSTIGQETLISKTLASYFNASPFVSAGNSEFTEN